MRDPRLRAPATAGWRLSELELVRAEVAEGPQQQGKEGKAGTGERASEWLPALQRAGVRRLAVTGYRLGMSPRRAHGRFSREKQGAGEGERQWCANSSGRPGSSSSSCRRLRPGGFSPLAQPVFQALFSFFSFSFLPSLAPCSPDPARGARGLKPSPHHMFTPSPEPICMAAWEVWANVLRRSDLVVTSGQRGREGFSASATGGLLGASSRKRAREEQLTSAARVVALGALRGPLPDRP